MSMTNTVKDSTGSATEHAAARSLRLRLALWLSSFIVVVAVVAQPLKIAMLMRVAAVMRLKDMDFPL